MYTKICKENDLALTQNTFLEMLSLMSCSGLLGMSSSRGRGRVKESRQARVKLHALPDDVRFGFSTDPFLAKLLDSKHS